MTDTTDLLTAVDALTKPNILTRYTGDGHDHEWRPVTRALTKDELKEIKGPVPRLRTVETGDWWCAWCPEVVTERPTGTTTDIINRRDDPPLLDQLQSAITADIGGSGAAGKEAHTRTPFDVGALTLFEAIDERVRSWMLETGGRPGKGVTVTQLLRAWFVLRQSSVRPEGEDDRFTAILIGWRTAIMDILDPPTQIPYMGQACPVCENTRARIVVAGDVEDTVALWAFLRPAYREEGSYGLCKACRTVLAVSGDPLQLRAMMNRAIVPVGRLTQTVGEAV